MTLPAFGTPPLYKGWAGGGLNDELTSQTIYSMKNRLLNGVNELSIEYRLN